MAKKVTIQFGNKDITFSKVDNRDLIENIERGLYQGDVVHINITEDDGMKQEMLVNMKYALAVIVDDA